MAEGKDVERGRKLLIPPFLTPQQEKKEQRKTERRVKIKASEDVEDGVAKLPPDIHDALDKPAEVEIIAPGGSSHEKKKVFRVVVSDKIPSGEIYVSPNELRALGVAENTVVTVRKK
ncbi:hypothetical protein [Pyrobaculum aerophilum]|uniref:Conserved protein n=2 Tax=Pyrobaculum aerophilum TaxID=13773 RepID=Q8ZVI2_PYRAE|nr:MULTISPECIES: hypothetical protein [Pyrobaculum]AAL64074.1 conserved protein [Pyrobaculum aerophilum str. IM2]MCX8135819.1 hypothetical protein [Pyrobaculum aerophilum]RFA97267.1 hypothetical protein CGL51_03405 [Pyrobaculum aerophilum]RFB00120.1 hypothetical protein CGL52_01890 [Pyrobaculum aerophilum]HII47163.1 hypothetical protein [Pyrobaculum aerophilum]